MDLPKLPSDPLFLHALKLTENLPLSASNLSRIGKAASPEAARAAFAQWELRRRAAEKFEGAGQMFFVREALEQATGQVAASYHAGLFPPDELVADLTAGIGGDSIALAHRGPTIGFELDPIRCEYANANLAAHGFRPSVENSDGLLWLESSEGGFAFADPARRVDLKRVGDPDRFRPNPARLAELGSRQRLCVIKLSPLLPDGYLQSLGTSIEFLSAGGECREVLIAVGSDASPGHRAVLAATGQKIEQAGLPDSVLQAGEFIYECDPAAIRAHAIGSLCQEFGLLPLGESNGYVTGPGPVVSPWLKSYQVLYEGNGDLKTTKRKLIKLESGTPVVKQRLVNLDLEQMRKALKLDGSRPMVLICYPVARKVRHAIATRIS